MKEIKLTLPNSEDYESARIFWHNVDSVFLEHVDSWREDLSGKDERRTMLCVEREDVPELIRALERFLRDGAE